MLRPAVHTLLLHQQTWKIQSSTWLLLNRFTELSGTNVWINVHRIVLHVSYYYSLVEDPVFARLFRIHAWCINVVCFTCWFKKTLFGHSEIRARASTIMSLLSFFFNFAGVIRHLWTVHFNAFFPRFKMVKFFKKKFNQSCIWEIPAVAESRLTAQHHWLLQAQQDFLLHLMKVTVFIYLLCSQLKGHFGGEARYKCCK